MREPNIFRDKFGDIYPVWHIMFAFGSIMIIATLCWAIATIISRREYETQRIINVKAKCESIGGNYGYDECYKDGKPIRLTGGEE